jgi:flagellar hook-associated protein 1 FlgK
MSNLTNALRIGTSGLNIAQTSLATVSHNVVNANTPGFSRQIVQPGAAAINGFGNGVQLQSIQRVADRFINLRNIAAQSDVQYAQTRKTYLDTLEGVMTGASAQGGLEAVAGEVFKSISELSNEPSNSALKRNVVQKAETFARTVRDVDTDLNTTATDADQQVSAEISNANQLLKDIGALNAQIAALNNSQQANGANANDLRDSREGKINELAKLFKLQVAENGENGAIRVSLENGRRMVDDAGYVQLKRTVGSPYQGLAVQSVLVDGSLSSTELPIEPSTLTSGKFKALFDTRDILVPNLKAQLEVLADTFRTEFNKVASQGSSVPPVRTLTSGNTPGNVAAATTDLYSLPQFAGLAGGTLHLSVVSSLGQPALSTQLALPITLPGAGPFSLNDLATLINADPNVGAGVTATAQIDANGRPFLQIQATNPNQRIVLANAGATDVLGTLGMNNVFTGTGAADFEIDAKFIANPELLPTARMRTSDGGLSNLDNRNILALAQLADTRFNIPAAGGLGAQTTTVAGYSSQMVSNLSVVINDAKDRMTFTTNVATQLEQLKSEVSGVNVNEELAQMLVYQNSFQASARIISITDQLLEELVNIVR